MQDYQLTDVEFSLFRDLIHRITGIALNDGKRNLVQSRLQKRLRYHGLASFGEYYDLIGSAGPDDPEMHPFINCVTTNKTDFYREAHHFDYISQHVVPVLINANKRGERPPNLRVWHAGCSTGEEPYTLAITLAESLGGYGRWDVRQLASDIDTDVLAHAERGVYEEDRVAPVPLPLLRKHFLRRSTPDGDLYKVKPSLAEPLTFRRINLLEDGWPIRPDVRFDIIFCRNVVIYFDKDTQQRLFARFAERLRPGGHLIIGHSESLLGVSDAFESIGHTIYRLPEAHEARRAA